MAMRLTVCGRRATYVHTYLSKHITNRLSAAVWWWWCICPAYDIQTFVSYMKQQYIVLSRAVELRILLLHSK